MHNEKCTALALPRPSGIPPREGNGVDIVGATHCGRPGAGAVPRPYDVWHPKGGMIFEKFK